MVAIGDLQAWNYKNVSILLDVYYYYPEHSGVIFRIENGKIDFSFIEELFIIENPSKHQTLFFPLNHLGVIYNGNFSFKIVNAYVASAIKKIFSEQDLHDFVKKFEISVNETIIKRLPMT